MSTIVDIFRHADAAHRPRHPLRVAQRCIVFAVDGNRRSPPPSSSAAGAPAAAPAKHGTTEPVCERSPVTSVTEAVIHDHRDACRDAAGTSSMRAAPGDRTLPRRSRRSGAGGRQDKPDRSPCRKWLHCHLFPHPPSACRRDEARHQRSRSRLEDMRRPTMTRGRFRPVFSSVPPGRVGARVCQMLPMGSICRPARARGGTGRAATR
jgi:hypothetical protein